MSVFPNFPGDKKKNLNDGKNRDFEAPHQISGPIISG